MDPEHASELRVIVVMGVAGAGKTTAGRALAEALGWKFYDADEFHTPEHVEKMRRGEALTDEDRTPWLEVLCSLIAGVVRRGEHAVLACSALKQWYRDALIPKDVSRDAVQFVHLDVPPDVLHERLAGRTHYFGPALLDSQLATLEPPRDALVVDGTRPVPEIVHTVREAFGI